MVGLYDYFTASGKYPNREKHPEVTVEVIKNASKLLERVNSILEDLEIKSIIVSSGFRPSDVNNTIPNAAKRSLHMQGLAIDIEDKHGDIGALLSMNDALKKKYGLWQEDSANTPGWVHLDLKDRGTRAKNTFRP